MKQVWKREGMLTPCRHVVWFGQFSPPHALRHGPLCTSLTARSSWSSAIQDEASREIWRGSCSAQVVPRSNS